MSRFEQFFQKPLEIRDEEDINFLNDLVRARAVARREGIYSPSQLGSCARQVYLKKTKVKGHALPRIESHAIFLDGTFRHFKWQFAVWQMHREGIVQLVDVGSIALGSEVFVVNEKGDYGGTIDQIIYVPDINYVCIADYKGMNGNLFAKALAEGPTKTYRMQAVGYAGLANNALKDRLPKLIEEVIILGENKNGAINTRKLRSPLGLCEWRIPVGGEFKNEIADKLKTLRAYERNKQLPAIECVNTSRMMFRDCPFNKLCRGEVEEVMRQKAKTPVRKKRRG